MFVGDVGDATLILYAIDAIASFLARFEDISRPSCVLRDLRFIVLYPKYFLARSALQEALIIK